MGWFSEGAVKRQKPGTAPTLGERAKKIPTDKGWDFTLWWSWRELNPRPQAFFVQFYMCSRLIKSRLLYRAAARNTERQ
jgi:hypothetical protein